MQIKRNITLLTMDEKTFLANSLQVQILDTKAKSPSRSDTGSAGYDIYSIKDIVVPARGKVIAPTGIAITVPVGCYGRIAPRSGLAAKHSIDVGAGVIDRNYTGEVRVILFNLSDQDYSISRGDRIAQLVLEQIMTPSIVVVDKLKPTSRGTGGFGSSGK
jgi:dUTP pyrophosphatase